MKIATSDLTGPALAWAVAEAEGRLDTWIRDPQRLGTSILDISIDKNTGLLMAWSPAKNGYEVYAPNENWSQGGPIIERGKIEFTRCHGFWRARMEYINDDSLRPQFSEEEGETHLIAAMRCFVASKLGDKVDIPKGLR